MRFRIRKSNPSGRTEASVTMIDGRKLKVNDTDWTEIDDGIFNASSMNPNFFEVEGEKPEVRKSKTQSGIRKLVGRRKK